MRIPAILQEASWIWPDSPNWDLVNCYALFRKNFSLPSVPRQAPFFITADQSYQLYVNGRYVCRGPARGFQKSWPYDEVDLRPWLKKGKNLIAVRAHNPGRSNFQYLHQGYAGFLAAARWGDLKIVTDRSWKCRRQTGINRNTTQTSIQLFFQEDIDLRMEDPRWMMPEYPEGPDWTPHEFPTAVWNSMPWHGLEKRDLPMLDESVISPWACLGRAAGRSRRDWRAARNLAISRFEEGLAHQPHAGSAESLEFPSSRTGSWRSYLVDFGKVVVGSIVLHIEGARGGESVETFHAETIDEAKLEPHFFPEDHCRMAFSHRLTCRPGEQEHQFFHTFGFRYMVLTVRDNAHYLRIRATLRTTTYPHVLKGRFQCSDENLNRIWEACAWTQRICSMDAYVDTPWREQAQWWGDARVQAWNTFHLSGDPRLLRRGIRQIGSQGVPSGITYGHAPTMAHNCILPDFTLIWMATMWDDYWQTGSLESFESQRAAVETALSYFETWTDAKTGLLRYDDRYWLFLDWTEIQRRGCSAIYSLWLLYVLDRLSALYGLASDRRSAAKCRRWATRLRKALLGLQAPDGRLFDGILPEGKINSHCSVHAQTLALMNRLSPKHDRALVERSLLPFLRGEFETKTIPSAYWITYVYAELAQRGHGAEVVADIAKKWATMADYGSAFEVFTSVPGKQSRSHAWSAHPLFHLMQILGGVRQTAVAWKEISYSPVFVGAHAEIVIPSPRGLISSRWKRSEPHRIEGTLVLPSGVRASVLLANQRQCEIEGPVRHKFTVLEKPL